jgi:hypothetical protein
MVQKLGNGIEVESPQNCAMGWKSLAYMLDPREFHLEGIQVLPDLGQLDSEMTEEHEFGAIPLFP